MKLKHYILYEVVDRDGYPVENLLYEVNSKELSINVQWADYSKKIRQDATTKFRTKRDVRFAELPKDVQEQYMKFLPQGKVRF